MGHEEYVRRPYFRELDGVRGVGIVLVVAFHADAWAFRWFVAGRHAVSVFFVLSGYLITTLALREETNRGRLALGRFYLRRAFRILPLYYLILLVYVVVYVLVDQHGRRGAMLGSLPYYVSYTNDFVPTLFDGSTPFDHTWSLAVQEKFYVVWPLAAFAVWWLRTLRLPLAAGSAVVAVGLSWVGADWALPYGEVMLGCVLALVLHHRRGFGLARFLGRAPVACTALALLCLVQVFGDWPGSDVVFPLALAAFLVPLVAGRTPWSRALRTEPLVWLGRRAYAVYLIHPMCLLAIIAVLRRTGIAFDAAGHATSNRIMWSCLVLVLALAVSAALADVLRRTVEEPFMALGRRLGRARREIIAADADADAAPTRAGRRDTSPAAAASNA